MHSEEQIVKIVPTRPVFDLHASPTPAGGPPMRDFNSVVLSILLLGSDLFAYCLK